VAKDADPRQQWSALEAQLARGLAPGYVLKCEEPWFGTRALSLLLARARAAGLEVCRHDVGEPGFRPAPLFDDLCGSAMFDSARCVVVERAEELLRKQGADDSALTRHARAFLEARRGTLVVLASGLRADHALVKAVRASGGELYTFRALWDTPPPWDPDPTRSELVGWIDARARELGVRLSRDAALLLAKVKGNDLSALDSELANLAQSGPAAVAALASDAAGSPRRLADLLADGDRAGALAEIERLWQGGFDKGRGAGRETSSGAILAVLFGSLRGNLRQALVGSAALAAGADPKSAADAAGVGTWPKARASFSARVGARTSAQWLAMQREAQSLERRSRGSAEVDANDLALFALRWGRAARGVRR
jgi:DNA polymerase III delta subunit